MNIFKVKCMCGLYACTIVSNIYPKNNEPIGTKYFGGGPHKTPGKFYRSSKLKKTSGKLHKFKKEWAQIALIAYFMYVVA